MSSAPGSSHLNYTVGALVAVGGAFGYAQRKSVPSLVAGVGIGYNTTHRTITAAFELNSIDCCR